MKIKKFKNEIYCMVDEDFISHFDSNHRAYMKKMYYDFYSVFCEHNNRKVLSKEEFFKNMRRRRIRFYQLCCPYCGTILLMPTDKRLQNSDSPNYCCNCGRASTTYTLIKHLSRFMRISGTLNLGLKELKKEHKDTDDWLLGYDCYQMEIIELASIIEVVCRECFEALIFIKNIGLSNDYIRKVISKSVGNDFMNIEKANKHYKKAFGIELKSIIDKKNWDNLIDIVNLRNMMVHNNGRVDEHFKATVSYQRLKTNVDDTLYHLEQHTIDEYFKSVMDVVIEISNAYLEKYIVYRHSAIANYYFNIKSMDFYEAHND